MYYIIMSQLSYESVWFSPDAEQPAAGGGGPSRSGVLPEGGAAPAALHKPAPDGSSSCPVAVSAPARLHCGDPPQTVPAAPAGPPPLAGC